MTSFRDRYLETHPRGYPKEFELVRRLLIPGFLSLFLSSGAQSAIAGEVEVHYAPVENLERIDVDLIRSAHATVDMAAYSLTDWPVVDALIDAHRRGVVLRIVFDPNQQHAFDRLREIEGFVRTAPPGP